MFPFERRDAAASVTVHDLVLAAIPSSLLLVALVGVAVSLSVQTALAFGSLPAGGVVGYALFLRPPDVDGE